jgi:hypothetical protein
MQITKDHEQTGGDGACKRGESFSEKAKGVLNHRGIQVVIAIELQTNGTGADGGILDSGYQLAQGMKPLAEYASRGAIPQDRQSEDVAVGDLERLVIHPE